MRPTSISSHGRDAPAARTSRITSCACCGSSPGTKSPSSMAAGTSSTRAWSRPIGMARRLRLATRSSPRPSLPCPRYSCRRCSRATRWTASSATRRWPASRTSCRSSTERSLVGLVRARKRARARALAARRHLVRQAVPPRPAAGDRSAAGVSGLADAPFDGRRVLLVEPSSDGTDAAAARRPRGARPPAVACIVGPEGGWSAASTTLRSRPDACPPASDR